MSGRKNQQQSYECGHLCGPREEKHTRVNEYVAGAADSKLSINIRPFKQNSRYRAAIPRKLMNKRMQKRANFCQGGWETRVDNKAAATRSYPINQYTRKSGGPKKIPINNKLIRPRVISSQATNIQKNNTSWELGRHSGHTRTHTSKETPAYGTKARRHRQLDARGGV